MVITNSNINFIYIADTAMPSLRFLRTKIHMSEVMNEKFVALAAESQELQADG
jgi:hypothetical protein